MCLFYSLQIVFPKIKAYLYFNKLEDTCHSWPVNTTKASLAAFSVSISSFGLVCTHVMMLIVILYVLSKSGCNVRECVCACLYLCMRVLMVFSCVFMYVREKKEISCLLVAYTGAWKVT